MTDRRAAGLIGALFLVATATFIPAEQLILAVLRRPNYLIGAAGDTNALTLAALLAFVDGAAVVAIAAIVYPLLRPTSERLALGYLAFRVTEFGAVLSYLAAPLMIVALGHASGATGVEPASLTLFESLPRAQHDLALRLVYLLSGVAGTIFAVLLYRSAVVPRSIAILGMVGYPALLAGVVCDLFGLIDVTEGIGLLAVAPGGLFELILPIWLLARGFRRDQGMRRQVAALGTA